MRLASLHLGGSAWVVGELLGGLPPPSGARDEDDEPAPADPVRLADAAIVLHVPIPIEGENPLAPGRPQIGVMGGDSLISVPLPCPLNIEYGETAPPWQLMEVDEDQPPEGGIVKRYLALMRARPPAGVIVDGGAPSRESKRTRLTS